MAPTDTPAGDDTDPRLDTRYVATVDGNDGAGAVTLVGVVHDHPASVYRVERVVDDRAPNVLALELPPLAIPLYEAYAGGERAPPALGGEFGAAVRAADAASVVGIDGPSTAFARTLAERLRRERASIRTAGRSLRSLLSVTTTALACRAAATVTRRTGCSVAVGSSTDHEVSWRDAPDEQAADERAQIRTATAVMDAIETPPSSRYRSDARERHMVDRLASLRRRGDVVAVVGAGHFDPVRDRLSDRVAD